jgi:argonaute-like protein implicated in RNA metabolism and viral defense
MSKLKKLLPKRIIKESVVSEAPSAYEKFARNAMNLKSLIPAVFRKNVEPWEAVEYTDRLAKDITILNHTMLKTLKSKVTAGEIDDATRKEISKLVDEIDFALLDVNDARKELEKYLDSISMS